MSDSLNTNGASSGPLQWPDKWAGALGFETMPEDDTVVRGAVAIDRELDRLLHENPPKGEDPEMRSLALGAMSLWRDLREGSLRGRPSLQLPKPGEPRTIRFGYLYYAPDHSLSLIVYPEKTVDFKLVLNGYIQAYELSAAITPLRATYLLERLASGVKASPEGVPPLTFAGPANSQGKPLYHLITGALGLEGFSANYVNRSRLSEAARKISRKLFSASRQYDPLFGGTAPLPKALADATELWQDHYPWSEAHEVPSFVLAGETDVYFGYRLFFPVHSFEIVIRKETVSWCLVIAGDVVSFDMRGYLGNTVPTMQRFALAAHRVPFNSERSRGRDFVLKHLEELDRQE